MAVLVLASRIPFPPVETAQVQLYSVFASDLKLLAPTRSSRGLFCFQVKTCPSNLF